MWRGPCLLHFRSRNRLYFSPICPPAVALTSCMKDGGLISVDALEAIMVSTAATGFIDPLKHLARTRLWLLSATSDSVVKLPVVQKAAALYAKFQDDPASQVRAWCASGCAVQLHCAVCCRTPRSADPGHLHAAWRAQPACARSSAQRDEPLHDARLPVHQRVRLRRGCVRLQRCAERLRGVSPPASNLLSRAAGSALQWLYFGRLSEPSADVRDYYASEQFRIAVAASAAVKARSSDSAPALRGSRGSLYGFDQSLFVDGTVWSSAFGLSQVRGTGARLCEAAGTPTRTPSSPPLRSHLSISQTRASRRPIRSRPYPASCTPRCTAASRRCRTSATSS